MKSRFALLSMIVLGLLMSSTGATLAISGSSDSGSAGIAQYGKESPDDDVLGDTKETGPVAEDDGDVAGDDSAGGGGSAPEAQQTQQIAASGNGEDSLPFTGFLAIPLLVGGVALIGSGAILRHRARD